VEGMWTAFSRPKCLLQDETATLAHGAKPFISVSNMAHRENPFLVHKGI